MADGVPGVDNDGRETHGLFDAYLRRWDLVPAGEPMTTRASHLLPVLHRGRPAMLKLTTAEDERRGGALMVWWAGDGAADVLASDGAALLTARATGVGSLGAMARTGRDDEACRILCAAAMRLHAPRKASLPALVPLPYWFRELEPAAARYGGILVRCADVARELLATPRETVVLHGDLHHGNVLDFGERGWLTIDPKGLIGERTFDFANIFTNPDLDNPTPPVAVEPGRFLRRLDIVTVEAGLDRTRLLAWILAWTGLSAAWYLDDGDPATVDLAVAALAAAELDR